MNPLFNFDKSYELFVKNNWDSMYVAVDLHDTIIYPTDTVRDVPFLFYPYAMETLQLLSKLPFIKLILFTGSNKEHRTEFTDMCVKHGIHFRYINENPECEKSRPTADFTVKFYYNVLLDDRGGFEGHTDWKVLYNWITKTWAEQL